MQSRQHLTIQFVGKNGEQLAVSNVLVQLEFFVSGNSRYIFKVGRTDVHGTLRVSYDEVESLRATAQKQFLMDYNSKLEDCDPTIRIIIPTEQDLLKQYQKVEHAFQRQPEWATPWPSNKHIQAAATVVRLTADANIAQIEAEYINPL